MKWICWACGAENPYRPLKMGQPKCAKCGEGLKIARSPLAVTTMLAGFLLMLGGVMWGRDQLVPKFFRFHVYVLLSTLFAIGVALALVFAGLALYNRAAHSRREGGR